MTWQAESNRPGAWISLPDPLPVTMGASCGGQSVRVRMRCSAFCCLATAYFVCKCCILTHAIDEVDDR
jgi:hypothetical protein